MNVGSVVKIHTIRDEEGRCLLGIVEAVIDEKYVILRYTYSDSFEEHNGHPPEHRKFIKADLTVIKL